MIGKNNWTKMIELKFEEIFVGVDNRLMVCI